MKMTKQQKGKTNYVMVALVPEVKQWLDAQADALDMSTAALIRVCVKQTLGTPENAVGIKLLVGTSN